MKKDTMIWLGLAAAAGLYVYSSAKAASVPSPTATCGSVRIAGPAVQAGGGSWFLPVEFGFREGTGPVNKFATVSIHVDLLTASNPQAALPAILAASTGLTLAQIQALG